MVAFGNHVKESRDIAAAPIGVPNRRFDLGDVEELIDERKQTFALALHYFCFFAYLLRCKSHLLEVVAQPKYNSERSAEFVGDIGEKQLA